MHFSVLLTLLPATALASHCPRDFILNTTMAEGPCSATPVLRVSSTGLPLPRVSFSNGTSLRSGDFQLWNDKAFELKTAPVSMMHGAITLGSKMDLGFYAPVCSGQGVCGTKPF